MVRTLCDPRFKSLHLTMIAAAFIFVGAIVFGAI